MKNFLFVLALMAMYTHRFSQRMRYGKKLDDGVSRDGRGKLSVIEVEVYESM